MYASKAVHSTNQGIVFKKSIGNYTVQAGDRVLNCELSPRLRKVLVYPTADPHSLRHVVREVREVEVLDPVAVGDQVRFVETPAGPGLIVEVLPRRSWLVRREATGSSRRHALEQVIVANLDQVVPVFSAAQPAPKWGLLDRYLVSAESLGLPSLICITKLDLGRDDRDLMKAVRTYEKAGYPVPLTSAVTGDGISALRADLQGKVSVFIGKSGVGKTSLLNALQPGLGLRVSEVSQLTGKGRHTTTNLAMFPLDFGGSVVDTPGMREFGLWEVDESDLALLFPEMRPLVGKCKFGLGCSHRREPGCAIRTALAGGKISEMRYESYLKLSQGYSG